MQITESGRKILGTILIAGIVYYIFGPVGLAVVALVLLFKKAGSIKN